MTPRNSPEVDAATQKALRALPAVDQLLHHHSVASLIPDYSHGELKAAIRAVLDRQRSRILAGDLELIERVDAWPASFALQIRGELQNRSRPNLRRVVNATGIILHTGLGRAPLADEAVQAIVEIAAGYCNLELDLERGERGDRHASVRELLCELTGAEDAIVVNNNAAATVLALAALATGREVIISRGQLVEIGGSYRMPEIMAASGCRMIEVGTTNRTRLSDYANRITPETAILLWVHTSNFRIRGFVEAAELRALAELADSRGIVVVDDLGSGLLDRVGESDGVAPRHDDGLGDDGESPVAKRADSTTWEEPTVRESVSAGAGLILFSGDKLLGGPQAGIMVGRRELIARCRAHPLMRAFRPDKMTFAALEATLRLYRNKATATQRIPVLRMLRQSAAALEPAAVQLAELIRSHLPDAQVRIVAGASMAGGGSLPDTEFPTFLVYVQLAARQAADVAAELRRSETPIVCRVQEGAVVFDPRTLTPGDEAIIATALAEIDRDGRP
jgi:L-seryl-tRNA(Ser) seleniumtransferase